MNRTYRIGERVSFTFETKTGSGGRLSNYAIGEVVKIGKRLTVRIVNGADQHRYWRDRWLGKFKVVHPERIIPLEPAE